MKDEGGRMKMSEHDLKDYLIDRIKTLSESGYPGLTG
jgi:hypothetical protein